MCQKVNKEAQTPGQILVTTYSGLYTSGYTGAGPMTLEQQRVVSQKSSSILGHCGDAKAPDKHCSS